MRGLRNVRTVFAREFKAYFDSPVAYVFLVAFLVLVGFLTFGFAMFYERRQADLTPFFFWHPWVYLLLVPAATMGLWADERRNGTAELLLTLPLTLWEALVGKFLAAWAFMGVALALTFPVVVTAGWLGSPDWGAVACGYIGSLFLAGAAAAIGVFASALSRSQVIGFVISLVLTFLMLIIGFNPVVHAVANWGVPAVIVNGLASCSLLSHFEALQRGVLDLSDIAYYLGLMVFMLVAAKTVIDTRKTSGCIGLAAVAVIVVAADLILASLPLRADLTADRLYSLSDGSRAVLGKLEDAVTVKCFVSSSAADLPVSIKTYATRVENLLKEYERAAGGNLTLETYDPKPDSDAEEWAQRYGIEPQTINPFGSPVYFGIVAVCGDREETLPAVSPRGEATLEYDLTRLVTRVAWPERPVVGVMTSLPDVLGGEMNPMMMQMGQRPSAGWAIFSELKKDYDVRSVSTEADTIDADVKTLIVVHPKNLSDKALYAIDQFVLRGGRLIACVDPLSVMELMASRQKQNPMMMQMGGAGDAPSTLGKLFETWGVTFTTEKMVADLAAATRLNAGNNRVEENPAFLSLSAENMDKDDLLVARLSEVMLPFAGAFAFDGTNKDLTFTPIMTTSKDGSCLVDRRSVQFGMDALKRELAPDGQGRVVAARLAGKFRTAYPKGPDGTNDVSKALAEGTGTVVLFGDADFLADQFCVQVMNTPFGTMVQPLNDNLALFSNVIEQFAGREELIGIRSRGRSDRPFEKVRALEAKAMAKWQSKERELESALQETRQRLVALQKQKSGNDRFIFSKEQEEEYRRFRKVQADTSRQLKNVRKELTADIDALGMTLKCLNILLMPILVILFGLGRGLLRKRH